MSYYMGDYYRGDPGIGSFFGGLLKSAVGLIPGVGPVASSVVGKILPGGGITAAAKGVLSRAGGAMVKHPVLTAAGVAGAGMAAGAGAERMITGGACGRGRHNKRPLKHCGATLKSGKCGKCYRSMNVCNPHALRRAVRRTRGFAKLAMRTIHIIHPKKKGRFGGFKKRKAA